MSTIHSAWFLPKILSHSVYSTLYLVSTKNNCTSVKSDKTVYYKAQNSILQSADQQRISLVKSKQRFTTVKRKLGQHASDSYKNVFTVREQGISCCFFNLILSLNKYHIYIQILKCQIITCMAWCTKGSRLQTAGGQNVFGGRFWIWWKID